MYISIYKRYIYIRIAAARYGVVKLDRIIGYTALRGAVAGRGVVGAAEAWHARANHSAGSVGG